MSEEKLNILYIDDEPHNLRTFKSNFKWDYNIFTVKSAFDGFDILEKNEIQLIISDQRMAGLSGTEFFKRVVKRFPDPIRIILTGYSDVEIIIRAINECGIHRYVAKPWKEVEMKKIIENSMEVYKLRKDNKSLIAQLESANKKLKAENTFLKEEINAKQVNTNIITQNKQFQKTLQLVKQVAPTSASVLIQGESGTGKELLAKAIHNVSNRKEKAFIKVNCAALPATLIESELFGHERGAFTGATQKRLGRFELADEGTIFLDEIGELPLELQAKLLRVLQEGEFERLGASTTSKVDVRIIAATNRDLESLVNEGTFRNDLFFRLNVFPITSPPLRDRKDDIPILTHHFLAKKSASIGRKISKVTSKNMSKLTSYNFPGNVRELENIVERFMITSPDDSLELDTWHPIGIDVTKNSTDFMTMEEMEIYHITNTLKRSGWKIFGPGGAAEKLAMNGKTLSSRMSKLGIKKQ